MPESFDDFPWLLPGEAVISSVPAPVVSPSSIVDAQLELARLAGVSRPQDIGTKGPPMGALSLKTQSGSEYLRLFEAVFGRDSLMVSLGLVDEYPRLAETTVVYLASQQGVARDVAPQPDGYDRRGEAPGRIAHEIRDPDDPVARKLSENNGWGWPYYGGQVDANDLFVLVAAALGRRHPGNLNRTYAARDGKTRTLGEALVNAFLWSQSQADNAEHLIECRRVTVKGQPSGPGHGPAAYPTWQDSPDSTMRANGDLCTGPVALAELQAHRFDALKTMASLMRSHHELQDLLHVPPERLEEEAHALRASVLSLFWHRNGDGMPSVAYGAERQEDGTLRPLRVRKSNAGHLLNSGILEERECVEEVATLVRHLVHPDEGLLCPSGIRTLSSREKLFRPCAYHNGTVWLWDSLWIARGLRRHGYHRCANHLFTKTLEVCRELRYYPEHIRGLATPRPSVNDRITVVESYDPYFGAWRNQVEQPPQVVQAWTVMAYLVSKRELSKQEESSDTPPSIVKKLDAELADAIDATFHRGSQTSVLGHKTL